MPRYSRIAATSFALLTLLIVTLKLSSWDDVRTTDWWTTGWVATAEATAADDYSKLKAGIQKNDMPTIKDALKRMVQAGGAKNMKRLLMVAGKIPTDRDGLYWIMVRGVASFVDEPALDELGDHIAKIRKKGIARDLLYALARNRTRHVATVLAAILSKGGPDIRQMAAEQLGSIPSKESVDALIAALDTEISSKKDTSKLIDDPIIRSLTISLTRLTGKEFGPNAINWKGWWKQNPDARLAIHKVGDQKGGRTGTAADYLEGERQKQFFALEKAGKKGVVVLTAKFKANPQRARDLNNDSMENILSRMRVPHTSLARPDFLDFDLSKTGAILINCAQYHQICVCKKCKPSGQKNNRLRSCSGCEIHVKFSAALTPPQIEKLVNFVKGGGYVFCEDWVLLEFIQKAYPKYLTAGAKLKSSTVDVTPSPGQATHPYLKGLFVEEEVNETDDPGFSFGDPVEDDKPKGRTVVIDVEKKDAKLVDVEHQWRIDDESFAIKVTNKSKVTKLLSSGKLRTLAAGDSLVAAAFRPGSSVPPGGSASAGGRTAVGRRGPQPGVVACVLSHFGKQTSRVNEASIENLLLNFLIDANVAREIREAPPKPKRRR